MRRSARHLAFLGVAVALVAVSGWRIIEHHRLTRNYAQVAGEKDRAQWGVTRYTPFQAWLKPAYGPVGFVARTTSGNADEARGRYQIAAYALAPIVLARSDEPRLLIVDFPSNEQVIAYANAHRMRLIWGPQPGVALLERTQEGLR